jgi:hypothetical protein
MKLLTGIILEIVNEPLQVNNETEPMEDIQADSSASRFDFDEVAS